MKLEAWLIICFVVVIIVAGALSSDLPAPEEVGRAIGAIIFLAVIPFGMYWYFFEGNSSTSYTRSPGMKGRKIS